MGNKETYAVSELIKGARDAEDAVKKFKEDAGNFAKPVVSVPFFSSYQEILPSSVFETWNTL